MTTKSDDACVLLDMPFKPDPAVWGALAEVPAHLDDASRIASGA